MNCICITQYIHCFAINKYTKSFLITKLKTDHWSKPQSTLGISTTALVCIFSSILNRTQANLKNPITKSKKCRSKEHLKANLFCHVKKNKKADRLCLKFSSILNTTVHQMPQQSISKSIPPHSVVIYFSTPGSESAKQQTNILSLTTLVLQDYRKGYIL